MSSSGSRDYYRSSEYHALALVLGTIIVVLLILLFASERRNSRIDNDVSAALDDLKAAEDMIRNTEQYGGSLTFDESCDSVLDNIIDAEAWLTLHRGGS